MREYLDGEEKEIKVEDLESLYQIKKKGSFKGAPLLAKSKSLKNGPNGSDGLRRNNINS